MAELLRGKHKPEEDNNNCIISNDKHHDDDVTSVKRVMKFDSLTDKQLLIPDLFKTDDDGETSASNFATEDKSNYNLSLTECDCCPEMTTIITDDSDKINEEIIKTGLPPAVEEWIDQAKNRIAKFESSLSDAAISAEQNSHTTAFQEIKAMDRHETSSWMEDFELKLDESLNELENDENHDSNNDNRKDDFMESSPRKLPITRQRSSKGTENHGNVVTEIVDRKIKDSVESTPKTANGIKKRNRKRQSTNQTTLMKYLSPANSQNTSSKIQKPQVKSKKEATNIRTIVKLPDGVEKIFNAKVVLERLPLSLLPATPNSKHGIGTKIPKVQVAAQSSKTPKKADPSSKFKRYCVRCRTSIDSISTQKDLKCSKCSRFLIFLCVTCNSQFEMHYNLTYHRRTKCNVVKQFECEHCDYKTPVKGNLKSHIVRRHSSKKKSEAGGGSKVETESNSIKRTCPKCRETVTTALSENCPRCTTPLEFTCLKCDDTFRKHSCTVHHLKRDCDEYHQDRLFHCPDCIRLPRDTMNCMLCPYKANAIFNLIEHLTLDHTMTSTGATDGEITQRDACTICGKEFANKFYLKGHERLCGKNVAIMKCKLCEYETKSSFSIKRHVDRVHANRR